MSDKDALRIMDRGLKRYHQTCLCAADFLGHGDGMFRVALKRLVRRGLAEIIVPGRPFALYTITAQGYQLLEEKP